MGNIGNVSSQISCRKATGGAQTEQMGLPEAHLSDLLHIGQPQEYLSDSVLHQRGHTIPDALVPQSLYRGLVLDELLQFSSRFEKLYETCSASVSGMIAVIAS